MRNFAEYSRYYDLLYRDKDYGAEADYLCGILKRLAPKAASLLELGCGTGRMAEFLAERGYCLHGVDLSETMLSVAETRREGLSSSLGGRLIFSQGDVRDVRLGKKFDAIISLFHVLSYQQRNEDIRAMLATAWTHLEPGGLFVFDGWYGPAVLKQRPEVRVKRCEDNSLKLPGCLLGSS